MTQIIHKLKCWPAMYQALLDGDKTFDVRRDDRNFQVGDVLSQREFDYNRQSYSGRQADYLVTYILRGKEQPHLGVGLDYVVLGVKPLDQDGVALIAKERKRQVKVERFIPERDAFWKHGELAILAALYALPTACRTIQFEHVDYQLKDYLWPGALDQKWWKPAEGNSFDGRIRELEKAGALIAAEIDRLKREKAK